MGQSYPDSLITRPCFLVPIDAALVPIVAGALKPLEERRYWASDADYERGYNAVVEFQICMTKACIDDLIESNNRLYRLLNTGLFGQDYTLVSENPLTITPAIPKVPSIEGIQLPGLIARVLRLEQLLDNALNGIVYTDWQESPGLRLVVNEILTALQTADNVDQDLLTKLSEIAVLLG